MLLKKKNTLFLSQEANENSAHLEEDDDDAPLKKPAATKKGKKTTATRHKLTATTIATSSTLSPPLVHFNEESNDSIMDEATGGVIVLPNEQAGTQPEVRRKRKYTKRNTQPKVGAPPSPSPPSTDTEEDSSDDNEGEDTKLSRICELAAKASSRLKKIEKQNAKVKSTGGAKRGRVVKMEVETVSTNISIAPHPATASLVQPHLQVATPTTTTTTEQPESPVSDEPTQTTVDRQEPATPPPVTPLLSPKIVSARDLKVKEKSIPSPLSPSSKAIITKPVTDAKIVKSVDKKVVDSIPPTSPPPKSFKIPKKANGENGQVSHVVLFTWSRVRTVVTKLLLELSSFTY